MKSHDTVTHWQYFNLYLIILFSISSSCSLSHHLVLYLIILFSISSSCSLYHHLVLYLITLFSISSSYSLFDHLVLYLINLFSISSPYFYQNALRTVALAHRELVDIDGDETAEVSTGYNLYERDCI